MHYSAYIGPVCINDQDHHENKQDGDVIPPHLANGHAIIGSDA